MEGTGPQARPAVGARDAGAFLQTAAGALDRVAGPCLPLSLRRTSWGARGSCCFAGDMRW